MEYFNTQQLPERRSRLTRWTLAHTNLLPVQVLRLSMPMPSQNRVARQKTALTETAVAVAKRPTSYALEEIAPLQPKRRIGLETRTETLSASFGAPLIVRAPGTLASLFITFIAKRSPSVRQPGAVVRP